MRRVRLTTVDNPYNPFTDWDQWFMYDMSKGYYTCERLASIGTTSSQLSDEENEEMLEEAMNKIIPYGAINKNGEIIEYIKVFEDN